MRDAWLLVFRLSGLKARDSKQAQARQHLESLEDLRLRSAAEQRDFGRELAALGEELEQSRDAARGSEGRASKLQVWVSGECRDTGISSADPRNGLVSEGNRPSPWVGKLMRYLRGCVIAEMV